MTVKDYLERNDKIREIANNIGIDIEQYWIELLPIASNFTFVLREDCYETVKPCTKDGRLVVYTQIQICFYKACVYDLYAFEKWERYLKSKGKKYRLKEQENER